MHCLQKHHFVVLIITKIFEDNFQIDDRCHQIFPQLKHNFFLTAFCPLKYRGFELSSLIWKSYLHMDMLFRKIYGKIFSCTICMSFLSPHNSYKWKLCSKLYLTWAIKTQNRALLIYKCCVTLTGSLIRWFLNEWPSVCRALPQCVRGPRTEKLRGRLTTRCTLHKTINSSHSVKYGNKFVWRYHMPWSGSQEWTWTTWVIFPSLHYLP
jgi:hypothetical protein